MSIEKDLESARNKSELIAWIEKMGPQDQALLIIHHVVDEREGKGQLWVRRRAYRHEALGMMEEARDILFKREVED